MRKAIWTAAVGLAALLPAAAVLWGDATVLAAGQVVAIVDDNPDAQQWGYAPATITVPAGTEITFRNDGQQPHTVTANDKSFDSPMLANGEEWKFTFASAGEFAYFCKPHPWMKGVVTVTGAAPAPAPTPTTTAPPPAPAPTPTTAATAPAPATGKAAPPPSTTTTAPAAAAPTTVTTAAPTTETTVAAPAPSASEPAAGAEAAETTAPETTAPETTDEPAAADATEAAQATEAPGEGEGHAVATLSGDDHETSGLAVGVAVGGTVLLLLMAVLSIPGRRKTSPLT